MKAVSLTLAAHRRPRWRLRPLALSLACAGAGAALAASPFPLGGVVPLGGGAATIGTAANGVMTIGQTTPRAIINWSDFSLGAGNTLNITQSAGPTSVLLNRVNNNGPRSEIYGTINAPGRVA